eukprot:SAG11_NODE_1103_length_5862_cov_8.036439_6_plen_196_part_00
MPMKFGRSTGVEEFIFPVESNRARIGSARSAHAPSTGSSRAGSGSVRPAQMGEDDALSIGSARSGSARSETAAHSPGPEDLPPQHSCASTAAPRPVPPRLGRERTPLQQGSTRITPSSQSTAGSSAAACSPRVQKRSFAAGADGGIHVAGVPVTTRPRSRGTGLRPQRTARRREPLTTIVQPASDREIEQWLTGS